MEKTKELKLYKGKVANVTVAAKDLFYIDIKTSNCKVKAGQFISILCGDLTLRRPFSVMYADDKKLTVLFKIKGKGTQYISKLQKGDEIDFSGPFGNGFTIENKKSLLVAAGVGAAPIYFLRNELNKSNIENYFISGFQNKESIPSNIDVNKITTDDGSYGEKGSILTYLEQTIKEYKPEKIYACGPEIVLKKVSELAEKHNIVSEIAMEKEMACSIGVCRGCVIELKNGKNATVCKDGPVFKGSEVKW